jgi:hypothetical protein
MIASGIVCVALRVAAAPVFSHYSNSVCLHCNRKHEQSAGAIDIIHKRHFNFSVLWS